MKLLTPFSLLLVLVMAFCTVQATAAIEQPADQQTELIPAAPDSFINTPVLTSSYNFMQNTANISGALQSLLFRPDVPSGILKPLQLKFKASFKYADQYFYRPPRSLKFL